MMATTVRRSQISYVNAIDTVLQGTAADQAPSSMATMTPTFEQMCIMCSMCPRRAAHRCARCRDGSTAPKVRDSQGPNLAYILKVQ
jgi:hypothetical protein